MQIYIMMASIRIVYNNIRPELRMKTVQHLTSVFNIPEIEDEIDFKKLYEKQKRTRIFYEKKAKELEGKLTKYMKENKHLFGKNKQQDIYNIIEQIKSFKGMLPNSVKEIEINHSDHSNNSIDEKNIYSLFKEFAIYGLREDQMTDVPSGERLEGTTVFSNDSPSQVLEHTSKLVFPSGTSVQYYSGKEAFEKSMDIINIPKQKLRTFVLTFQPTSFQKKIYKPPVSAEQQKNYDVVINILNPERRVYAICIILDEFTVLKSQNQPFQKIENRIERKKSEKAVRFKEVELARIQDLKIAVTERAYTIFSYYPFFTFFEELLKSLFYSIKVERYIKYKENGQNLQVIDSRAHGKMMKNILEDLKSEGNEKEIILNQLIDFSLGPNNKIYLQLSQENCESLLASDWAYPILSLFTLDVFLEVLTLMILEQKMVFVCQNKTILTYAIFLFTKVLMRPFQYPYPVVNLIPDQQQYLNAPFPIVYGYNKTRQQIISAKIPKKYKNTYVFFEPTGIEVMCEDNKKKILNNKSPKLRDKLLSKFKKMQRNYPKASLSLLNFISRKEIVDFSYTNNTELSKEIIDEVHNYMVNDIFKVLPNDAETNEIKAELIEKNVDEEELNQEVFKRIKQKYNNRSRDPFFNAFLETQLLNVHIFKY